MSFIHLFKKWAANRDLAFAVLILIVCLVMAFSPAEFSSPFSQQVNRQLGRVIDVDNSNIQQYGIVKAGDQSITAELLTGEQKGETIQAINMLLGKMETDKMFSPGDRVYLVMPSATNTGQIATAYDHYRLDIELLLVLLFAVLLVGFAGWSGVRALLSFIFALLLMWKVLLPGMLQGNDPVLTALAVVLLIAAVTLFLVAGVGKTALVAFIGAASGIFITIGLSFMLFPPFHLHGAVLPFSETLLYSGYEHLDLIRIFLAAVFLGASGAVIDVSIDVSASMNEVVEKRPDLSRIELIRSGFAVGRAMTSTMVTTLLMAYTAGYLALLMVFMAQGIPPANILNTNYLAAEILRTVVGSFGLVTVAPLTAVVGGLIYAHRAQRTEQASEPVTESGI
ncbi:MAG: YibE/F family protein [Chloroflexi bacterium]|nr:YibE/F family protein [Chloroflexota bacterium]